MPTISPVAKHEIDSLAALMHDTIEPLSFYNARARGRGIGAALLAALAETLPTRHAHKIWCDSRVENTRSLTVLERAGFGRIATLTNHWYGQDYYLWEWYPSPSPAAA